MCECGNPRSKGQRACNRCAYLDGPTTSAAKIIGAARQLARPCSIYELAQHGGLSVRQAYRAVKPLLASGRLIRRSAGVRAMSFYSLGCRS